MDSQNRTEPVHPDIDSRIPEKAGSVRHTEDERFLREYKQSNCSFKTYDEMIRSVQLTAEVFGGEAVDIANRYTAYLKERLDRVAKRVEDIPEENRTTVAHGNSIYELNFDGANTIIDEWIKYAGGINAAAEGMT